MSYFTMVSNIVVAVVFGLLAAGVRKTAWRVALVNTALLMITITSLVFLVAILPFLHLRGLALLTSPVAACGGACGCVGAVGAA